MKNRNILESCVYAMAIVLSVVVLVMTLLAGDLFTKIRLVYQMF